MPHEGIPLQHEMFSDKLADTRSRKQKRSEKQKRRPQQTELFSQKELAQFGVQARPELPAVRKDGKAVEMRLEIQDVRTQEERAAAQQEAAEEKTRAMFSGVAEKAKPPTPKVIRPYTQWKETSRQFPKALVLIKVGDLYETYDDTAKKIACELATALSTRTLSGGQRVRQTSVPVHAFERYVAKLLAKGHAVALCEGVGVEVEHDKLGREMVAVATSTKKRARPEITPSSSWWAGSIIAKRSPRLFGPDAHFYRPLVLATLALSGEL